MNLFSGYEGQLVVFQRLIVITSVPGVISLPRVLDGVCVCSDAAIRKRLARVFSPVLFNSEQADDALIYTQLALRDVGRLCERV